MKARQTAPRRRVCIVLGLLLGAALGASPAAAQTGILSGQVTADDGAVVAFRVKARDTVHRVSYTVYTVDGAYRIYNLPPSTYEVSVVEEGFDTAVREVEVTAGETVTADLSLSSTGAVASQGAGARGASSSGAFLAILASTL